MHRLTESLGVERRNRSFRLKEEILQSLGDFSKKKSINKSQVVTNSLRHLFKDYFFFKENFNYKNLCRDNTLDRGNTTVSGFILDNEIYNNLEKISSELNISKSIILEYSIEKYINKKDYTKVINEKEDVLFSLWSAQYLQCDIDR